MTLKKKRLSVFVLTFGALVSLAAPLWAAVGVANLRVEYRDRPLGIDVAEPRFSWQMTAGKEDRNLQQSAYEVRVRNAAGAELWDSGRVASSEALAIPYKGKPLSATTRYNWSVDLWTTQGEKLTSSSWFETGLMDSHPDAAAWHGAKWIGGSAADLVLYAPYLEIFKVSYELSIAPGSERASFVWGANDSRLMDANKNIDQLAAPLNGSYLKLELDLAGLKVADGHARLNLYRVGYAKADSATKPFAVLDVPTSLINAANAHETHKIAFSSIFGRVTITLDGSKDLKVAGTPEPPAGVPEFARKPQNSVALNPKGDGGDYIAFGMLCQMGFAVDAGQQASFRNLLVLNNRAPNSQLFAESLAGGKSIYAGAEGLTISANSYQLAGGSKGAFVVRDPSHNSEPMLRTRFNASKAVASARLYVTARGIYEIALNGQKVGDAEYAPGLTQYNRTHMYQSYDVTSLIKPGANALGAQLSEGWWSGLLSFGTSWNHFGDRQSLLAQLVISYKDGSEERIVTDPKTWKLATDGPVRYASMYLGQITDLRREAAMAGWSTASYDDSHWKPAVEVPLAGTTFTGSEMGMSGPMPELSFKDMQLIGQIGNSAGRFATIHARSVKEVKPGIYLYDLGQNIVGRPLIHLASSRPGQQITLRYAEMLYPDLKESGANVGMVMNENYRAAISIDQFTLSGGQAILEPRFTSHGFNYIEITGLDKPLPVEAVEGVVVSSVRQLTADYKSSNEKVNKLWSNLTWSTIDNFLTIPTDCPQRNERMGWSGDLNVFSRTATYISDADQFLRRHMYALRDVQEPSGRFTDVAPLGSGFGGLLWGSVGIVVPWENYLQYNDVALIAEHYPAMLRYMDYIETTLDPKTGISSDAVLGDWLGPQNNLLGSDFIATAYHAYDLKIMAKVAHLLGKAEDEARFEKRSQERKAFFNQKFVNSDHKTLGISQRSFFGPTDPANPPGTLHLADTQSSYAIGLAMDLFDEANRPAAIANLAATVKRENTDDSGIKRPAYSLMTGFIGTSFISKALSETGNVETAYRLLENEQFPSWLYPVNQGASTIWERLNGYTVENGFGGNNSMNSFNHYSFGAVGQWMLANSAGIERDEPGFRRFKLQPEPDPTGGIRFVEAHYDSPYGRIESNWRVEGSTLHYHAVVPPNTTATLVLPTSSKDSVQESAAKGVGVEFVKYEGGKAIYTLGSGSYEFTAAQ